MLASRDVSRVGWYRDNLATDELECPVGKLGVPASHGMTMDG